MDRREGAVLGYEVARDKPRETSSLGRTGGGWDHLKQPCNLLLCQRVTPHPRSLHGLYSPSRTDPSDTSLYDQKCKLTCSIHIAKAEWVQHWAVTTRLLQQQGLGSLHTHHHFFPFIFSKHVSKAWSPGITVSFQLGATVKTKGDQETKLSLTTSSCAFCASCLYFTHFPFKNMRGWYRLELCNPTTERFFIHFNPIIRFQTWSHIYCLYFNHYGPCWENSYSFFCVSLLQGDKIWMKQLKRD